MFRVYRKIKQEVQKVPSTPQRFPYRNLPYYKHLALVW